MRLAFVTASASNLFMTELLELVADGACAQGVDATVHHDGWPAPERDLAYVTVPHEVCPFLPPPGGVLARTVALCTEQPGTAWFETAATWAARCGAVADISTVGALGLRAWGLEPVHVQLGWCPALEAAPRHAERPVDVLYLGSAAPRREVLLAGYADALWPYDHRLLIPPPWSKPQERPDFVVGARKRELIAGAKVLLGLRRQPEPYFEWARALDAIAGGAVLVCEAGAGFAPLVPGEHLLTGGAPGLALLAEGLLHEPERRDAIAAAALERARGLTMGIPALLEAAGRAAAAPVPAALVPAREAPQRPSGPQAPPRPPDDEPAAAAARTAIADRRARERAAAADPDALTTLHDTRTGTPPRISVLVPAYRAAGTIAATLQSVAAQTVAAELEVLVHDDACPEGSGAVAAAFLAERPWLQAHVVRRAANAGLPAGRNTLAALARGPLLLVLDADNELLPPAAERLAAALDADPGAAFAYPVLAGHVDGRPSGLLSSLAWDPTLLRHLNPIDALALIRADALDAAGGYLDDLALYGWEDWDLWCTFADAGRRGVHVPQLLARYRRAAGSMLATTDLDQHAKLARLAARHPALFAA